MIKRVMTTTFGRSLMVVIGSLFLLMVLAPAIVGLAIVMVIPMAMVLAVPFLRRT
ncbi:MAG: hypothetical protein LBE83_08200 [Propionibacteriaceae bacterium]|jgi:hypothetical protein|nr:hypothetical protein [Propionibacteriaceae bacterium]